jgi:uracil-DNA glycosylase family 4
MLMDQKRAKQQQLDALYAPYKKCMECPLSTLGRSQVVFGSGNPDAQIMIIGEAPGKQEDIQGLPFVGRSGSLLNQVFAKLEITRDDLFITNIVKCRPPNNRRPTQKESGTCKSLLLINQIKIIRPKIICTLGSAALEGLLEQGFKISKTRGNLLSYQGIPLLPTYHPAYILRNPKELDTLIHDINLVIAYLKK